MRQRLRKLCMQTTRKSEKLSHAIGPPVTGPPAALHINLSSSSCRVLITMGASLVTLGSQRTFRGETRGPNCHGSSTSRADCRCRASTRRLFPRNLCPRLRRWRPASASVINTLRNALRHQAPRHPETTQAQRGGLALTCTRQMPRPTPPSGGNYARRLPQGLCPICVAFDIFEDLRA